MSAAQILSNARQLLERVGWAQFTERDGQDRACLVGALLATCVAANGFPTDGLAEPLCLLRRVIGNAKGEHWNGETGRAYNDLEAWNDEPERSYADVVALLVGAEEMARHQERAAMISSTPFRRASAVVPTGCEGPARCLHEPDEERCQ
jgi:hypothetical protein